MIAKNPIVKRRKSVSGVSRGDFERLRDRVDMLQDDINILDRDFNAPRRFGFAVARGVIRLSRDLLPVAVVIYIILNVKGVVL